MEEASPYTVDTKQMSRPHSAVGSISNHLQRIGLWQISNRQRASSSISYGDPDPEGGSLQSKGSFISQRLSKIGNNLT